MALGAPGRPQPPLLLLNVIAVRLGAQVRPWSSSTARARRGDANRSPALPGPSRLLLWPRAAPAAGRELRSAEVGAARLSCSPPRLLCAERA